MGCIAAFMLSSCFVGRFSKPAFCARHFKSDIPRIGGVIHILLGRFGKPAYGEALCSFQVNAPFFMPESS